MLTEPRRLLAIPHGLIAAGVAFRLHHYAAHPGLARAGLWVAIGLAAVIALGALGEVLDILIPSPGRYEIAGALYIGITVLVALSQRTAPVDAQVSNLLLFGGLGGMELVHWHNMRHEHTGERAA